MDPIWGAVAKSGFALATPVFKAAALEWKRRDPTAPAVDPSNLDLEMNEALDVLVGASPLSHEALLNPVKAVLSGVPAIFSDPAIKTWIGGEPVRDAIRHAVSAAISGDVRTAETIAHSAVSQVGTEPDIGAAAAAFHYALAFVSISLTRHLTVGERILAGKIDAASIKIGEVGGMISVVQDDVRRLIDRSEGPSRLSQPLLDERALADLDRHRRNRFYLQPDASALIAKTLGERLFAGDLSETSPEVRRRGLAMCARWRVHHATADELSEWLNLPGSDLEETVIARAFLSAQGDWTDGLAILTPLDTPAKRTAAIQIYAGAHTSAEVLTWLDTVGIDLADLDSDGRYVLLHHRALAGDWPRAFDGIGSLGPGDYESTPVLHKIAGHLLAASATAPLFRRALLEGQPLLNAADFPFDDTAECLDARDRAAEQFRKAAIAAKAAGSPSGANYFDSWALMLAMRNPRTRLVAEEILKAAVSDPETGPSVIPLALAFDVAIDREAAEATLDRLEALNPKGDVELSVARFALVQRQGSVDASIIYLERHRKTIVAHISLDLVSQLEVQLYKAAGREGEAAERLANARSGLTHEVATRLAAVLAQGREGEIADQEARFASDPNAATRGALLDSITAGAYSDRVVGLWLDQVRETRTRDAAETLARYLEHHRRLDRVPELLAEASALIPGSLILRAAKAWDDYRQGRFGAASTGLALLRTERTDYNDRALQVSLLIHSGRWPELSSFVEEVWADRETRDAQELLGAAELAARIGSPRLMELLHAAAEREKDNPDILIACYTLAIRAGRDDAAQANLWLSEAIRTSGEDGPIQSISISDLVEQAPDWDRSVNEVWDHLRDAELPLRSAAQLLRRPALELQLAAMIMNRRESDPRKRAVVPAFSGVRALPDLVAETLGYDVTALVNLEFAGLLGPAIARGGMHIAHDAVRVLFDDRQAMAFHQPSRMAEANALLQSILAGEIWVFEPSGEADPKLIGEIGATAAEMIVAAQTESATPRAAVRIGPVHRLGSFKDEPIDLSAHADALVSGQSIINALAAAGRLTQVEEASARAYLERVSDQTWKPSEVLGASTELYIDDVSVSHLRSMNLLDRVLQAGFKLWISTRLRDEARALLALQKRGGEIEAVIESLRLQLQAGISSGQITVCPDVALGEDKSDAFARRLLEMSARVDAVVIDDRYFNQLRAIAHDEANAPIWTSLEVIQLLRTEARITDAEWGAARTTLRQGGLIVFPVDEAEMRTQINAAVEGPDGALRETGELRAFRENISLMQLRGWLRLPQEAQWAMALSKVVISLIVEQWSDAVPDATARARSDWLLERIDHRNWSEMMRDGDGSAMAAHGWAWQLVRLMLTAPAKDTDARERFDVWLESHVDEVKDTDRTSYKWMLETLRQLAIAHHRGDT